MPIHLEKTANKKKQYLNDDSLIPLAIEKLPYPNTQQKPNFLTRLRGGILLFIGIVGCIFTSPLLLTLGCIGFLGGLIFGNSWNAGVIGARIGSLGTIDLFLYGLNLTRSRTDTDFLIVPKEELKENVRQHSEDTQQELAEQPRELNQSATSLKISTAPDSLFKVSPRGINTKRNKLKHDTEVFLNEIAQYNKKIKAETQPQKIVIEERKVKDLYIEKLISIIPNTIGETSFWERLEQMTAKDIQIFVHRLGLNNEFNILWQHFQGFEFEPRVKERKAIKFAQILGALSEEQCRTAFKSAQFLSILTKSFYVEAAANTLNPHQLAVFASDPVNQKPLNSLIEKLKPSSSILEKIIAIIPYATATVRDALLTQISHLPYPISFITKLDKLAHAYIKLHNEEQLAALALNKQNALQSTPAQPSKWKKIKIASRAIYAAPIQKEDLSDEHFDEFVQQLSSPSYVNYEQKIANILDHLPDNRIRMLVARGSLPEFPMLLKNLWFMEAKTLNQKSLRDSREQRLKVILNNLSELQLKEALKENKFWEIFRNTQEAYCKMAANEFSPQQFSTVITNCALGNQVDFATLLIQINKDSVEEKMRLQNVIEKVIPHTTPWFVLALEIQIKSILPYNKPLYEQLNHQLKINLSKSLQNPEIYQHYKMDDQLDKRAISKLIIKLEDAIPTLSNSRMNVG